MLHVTTPESIYARSDVWWTKTLSEDRGKGFDDEKKDTTTWSQTKDLRNVKRKRIVSTDRNVKCVEPVHTFGVNPLYKAPIPSSLAVFNKAGYVL